MLVYITIKGDRMIFKKQDVLTSMTDKGLVRKCNEDSVITLKHPLNNNIKLLAVADGMGGFPKGEFASKYVIKSLQMWFINEKIEVFNSTTATSNHLYRTIININNALYLREYNRSRCGTTLTCAIVANNDTVIANIGDSRAYAININGVKQLTKDDSLVWYYYEQGKLTKDELRFHYQNSLITKCIGHSYNTTPNILKINNQEYLGLLLLTDGITDCLSDDKIKFIVKRNSYKDIAKKLIMEAVYYKQHDKILSGIEFNNIINGKDNASVALYMKRL